MNRSDVNVRTLEGLEPRRACCAARCPERVAYDEGLVRVSRGPARAARRPAPSSTSARTT